MSIGGIGYNERDNYKSYIGETRFAGPTYIDLYTSCNEYNYSNIEIKVWEYENYRVPVANRSSMIKMLQSWMKRHPDAEVLIRGHD